MLVSCGWVGGVLGTVVTVFTERIGSKFCPLLRGMMAFDIAYEAEDGDVQVDRDVASGRAARRKRLASDLALSMGKSASKNTNVSSMKEEFHLT